METNKGSETYAEFSQGILNLANLTMFGEESSMAQRKSTNISEKLMVERRKALKTLEKVEKTRTSIRNKTETNSIPEIKSTPKTPGLERTDYVVPYVRHDNTNISDLVEEKTINLNSTNIPTRDSNTISFEPTEITGRSTLYKPDVPPKNNQTMSLDQILASSFSEKVRHLGKAIRESRSSFASLPKTADLSRNTTPPVSIGFESDVNFQNQRNDECYEGTFMPAENLKSKLAADEREWEMEFAPIPVKNMKISANDDSSRFSRKNEPENFACLSPESDFSIGTYFSKRCEDLYKMIPDSDSPVKRKPVALIDDSTTSSKSTVPDCDSSYGVSKINDKTYDKSISTSRPSGTGIGDASINESEHSNDKSYILSLSAIAEALNKIESDQSSGTVMNRILCKNTKRGGGGKVQPSEGEQNQYFRISRNFLENCNLQSGDNPTRKSEIKVTNKENLNPNQNAQLSETASFTESILNCSEIIKLDERNKTWKNPPLQGQNIKLTENKKNSRKHDGSKRHSKSPTNLGNMPTIEVNRLEQSKQTQDEDNKKSYKPIPAQRFTKLELKLTSPENCIAPRRLQAAQKDSRKRPYASLNRPSSPHLPEVNEATEILSPSSTPTNDQNISTVSSPRSLTRNLSPCNCDKNCNSPTFDNSSGSERRFLVDSSSPDYGGKLSLPNYRLVSQSGSCTSLAAKSSGARCVSQCSTSSEFSHHDGIMPLKATSLEVSWGSIKLRKNVKKSLQIKNASMKRLVVRIAVDGPGFQILSPEEGNLLTLQSLECRTIVLSFCPTVIGPAVGRLQFRQPDRDTFSRGPTIYLYGYGGHASIIPHGTFKGPVGTAFLTMGELRQLSSPLVKTFTVHNKGPLTGFAVILVDSIGVDLPRLRDSIEVSPIKALVPPEGAVKFQITFNPRRDEIKKIIQKISNVMTLANLKLITGDEPTRQRIRNLIRKMNDSEKSTLSSTSLEKVWNAFPDDMDIYELDTLKEQSEVAVELVSTLRIHEIALTLNHTVLDNTLENTLVFPDGDETIMFRTIIGNPTLTVSNSEKVSQDGLNDKEAETWSVCPNILEIDPFGRKKTSVLTVRSYFSNTQYFEVASNFKHLFLFSPSEGQIPPGGSIDISVSYFFPSFLPTEQINVVIYIENGKITVPVQVSTHNVPPQFR